MPPKKREKDSDSSKNQRNDNTSLDHELFLTAYEKPTQIYRYLGGRHILSPVFLHRSLTYMKGRMSRTNKNRKEYKVDRMLDLFVAKRDALTDAAYRYLNLTFFGFFDKSIDTKMYPHAHLSIVMVQVGHKKRKDSSGPIQTIPCASVDIPTNPSSEKPSRYAPTITIPTNMVSFTNGTLPVTYFLLLRVQCLPNLNNSENENVEAPILKKKKSHSLEMDEQLKVYGAKLVIYDKQSRCLLPNGDYEIFFEDVDNVENYSRNFSRNPANWENITKDNIGLYDIDNFETISALKFYLCWSNDSSKSLVSLPKQFPSFEIDRIPSTSSSISVSMSDSVQSTFKTQIVYQFLYNNNTRQQTQTPEDFRCPWCSVNCIVLYSLLKHLKYCHSRFNFAYVPTPTGARIDVSINDLYDGSYSGSPHDLVSQPPGCAFSRNGPMKRCVVTNILVFRPKRSKPSLSEFIEVDDIDYDGHRPYITGHNRLYHHTTTCLPIFPKEIDVDSEQENDPEWLQKKTMAMIDEFTDVNEGEKELMKLWNLHVMKYGFVGDCQIALACLMFGDNKGRELILKKLHRNLVTHLCSLFDFGLISPVHLFTVTKRIRNIIIKTPPLQEILKSARKEQVVNWLSMDNNPLQLQASTSKTPTILRKPSTPGSGQPRRKGAPSSVDLPSRRKSTVESTRKRLSMSLKKEEFQG